MLGMVELGMIIRVPVSIDSKKIIRIYIGSKLKEITMVVDYFSKEKVILCDIYEPLPC